MSKPTISPRLQHKLERVQAAQKAAQERARAAADCAHDQGDAEFVTITGSGARYVYVGCRLCKHRRPNGTAWVDQEGRDLDTIEVVEDRHYDPVPCVVCGTFGTELHHWAPRQYFGAEADHWPTANLCPPCHARWHSLIYGE